MREIAQHEARKFLFLINPNLTKMLGDMHFDFDFYVPDNGKYKPIRSYESELNRANERIAEIKQAFADRLDALEASSTVAPTEPFAVDGYYPLYSTEEAANAASDAGTNHSHTLNGVEYYMPDGGTLYHGNYGDSDY